ncbi:MAG: sigma-70 family RNA polymerase sigma factor [Lachnospiraceae bacterium]|nr:sigma-70 family RNA polymerase sigma factor [Lachnospiraceae bacterium]
MSENINETIARMYEEHREKLRMLAECIIHDYYASYDMVEDTFLHLVMHAEWLIKLTEPMKIRYIYSSCKRICMKYVSETARIYTVPLDGDEPGESRYSMLEAVIEREALKKCIDELHPEHRKIFLLHYVNNIGYGEIARINKVSRESVIKCISRIRQKLRDIIKDKYI